MSEHRWRKFADWAKHRPATLRLAAQLGRGRGRFRFLDAMNPPSRPAHVPDLSRWASQTFSACWIGHATVLLRMGGMNILTDPAMLNRVGVGLGLMTGGPRRFTAPAIGVRELPPLDLILVSHAHFDHLDRPTLLRLRKSVPVVAASDTRDLIADLGFRNVTELRWGERARIGALRVTAVPVKHWGARTFYDEHRGCNAYVIEADNRRVLYGGDTAYHEGFRELAKVDLAILGIGAYDPWIAAHATPEQAWEMANHVRADHILPMHHSTFRLSYEPVGEPIERMMGAASSSADRIIAPEIGMCWSA